MSRCGLWNDVTSEGRPLCQARGVSFRPCTLPPPPPPPPPGVGHRDVRSITTPHVTEVSGSDRSTARQSDAELCPTVHTGPRTGY